MPAVLNTLLVVVAIAAFASLFTGAGFLVWLLPGGLPLGNALTAIGLCAAGAAAIRLSPRGSFLRALSMFALGSSLLWLPVSIVLAGNLELNFSGHRGSVWIWMSIANFATVLSALVWALVRSALTRNSSRNPAS
ncbi:MAG: hypothetical protein AAFX56_17000 [Pseudomonadota bacterium]